MTRRLILLGQDHPWLVLALIAALTLAALVHLPKLQVRISATGMMVEGDPAREFFERTVDTFGSDNATVVLLSDPDLFSPGNLTAVREAVQRLQALPFVSRTESLFSVRNIKTVEGYVTTDPYLSRIPQSPGEARSLIAEALRNPLVEKNLLSPQGTAMAVNVYLHGDDYYPGFDLKAAQAIGEAIAPLQGRLEHAFHLGLPYVRAAMTERINADQALILPLSLAVLVVSLGLTLRRLNAALIPLLTAGLSVLWTLGMMAALGISIDVMTAIVPALLIIIGSTEDIHLIAEYHAGIQRGASRAGALELMARHMGTAVLLTFVTTYLGFLSIAVNRIHLLQEFGFVASTGLLANFLITILLVPICLKLFGERQAPAPRAGGTLYERLASSLFRVVLRHRIKVLSAIAALVAISLVGASLLRVDNNTMSYFEPDSDIVQRAQMLHEELAGMRTISLVLTGTEGTFLRVGYLEQLQELQQFIAEHGAFDKSVSFADFIAVTHGGIDAEFPGHVYLPARDEVVREYMNFIDHGYVSSWVSRDFSQARVLVRHNIGSSHALSQAVADLQAFMDARLDPGLEVRVTGQAYLNSQATDYMSSGQAQSLALMVLVIFVILSLLFFNARAGLLAVMANLFPVVVLFGVMGYAGIPLDTGTVMIGAIALGICVDHSMHFMVRYHRRTREHGDVGRALGETVTQESVPLIATALALALGFAMLASSRFPPVANFGLLSAMVMLLALVSTFVILPALLTYTRLITVWDLMFVQLRDRLVDRCPLFDGMSAAQVRKVVVMGEVREFAAGELMVRQGESASLMYVILDGSAQVWQTRADGSRFHLATLDAGDVLGEIAPASHSARIADVVAAGPARALALSWSNIERIARSYPRISSKLFLNLTSIVGGRLVDIGTRESAIRDELTGAYTRPYFGGLLQFAVDEANRFDEPLSLLMFVLRPGEAVQGPRGARIADALLEAVTEQIASSTRRVDVFARWDGAQFVILLPHTTLEQGRLVGERVRRTVRSSLPEGAQGVSVSVGLTELHERDTLERLIARAELAAREAANNGSGLAVTAA